MEATTDQIATVAALNDIARRTMRVDFGEVRRRFAFGDVQRLEQDHPLARQAGLVDSPSPIGRLNSRLEVSPVEVQILAAQGAPGGPHRSIDVVRDGPHIESRDASLGDPNVRRLLAVHSLPWRGMNRRLIVQFDPDEPSMSAPTFAEPDQGPLAGGRKVNARHDLTLGLWRRDCEISRGFPRR